MTGVVDFRDLPPEEQSRMRAAAQTPEARAVTAQIEADWKRWDGMADEEIESELTAEMEQGTPVAMEFAPDCRFIRLPAGWPDDDGDTLQP